MPTTQSRTRVRYKDTDQMGIAHHSNYIVWFEIGRTDLCREVGITYGEIEQRGYLLVVTEVLCRYRTPFLYDQEVVIETRIAEAGSRLIQFAYDAKSVTGDSYASGSTRHVWLDRQTRRPVRAPKDLLQPFLDYASPQ